MPDFDLLAELDEAEHCRCGKTHEECAEDGGCKWSRLETEIANLRHALKEAGKEMDCRYEMGVAAGWAACVRHLRTVSPADLLDRHGLQPGAGAAHVLAAAASDLLRQSGEGGTNDS